MSLPIQSLKSYKNPKEIKLPYNTAYYNFGLLSELDFIIGGYGKADHKFIFNLNTFVEAFVLNEVFLVSKQEWDHHFCIAKEVFKDGRPITNLVLTNPKGVTLIGWPVWIDKGVVKFVKDMNNPEDKKEESNILVEFQKQNSEYINDKYFKEAYFKGQTEKYSYLWHGISEVNGEKKRLAVFETETTFPKLLNGMYNTLSHSIFQTALPFRGFKSDIEVNKSLGVPNKTYDILAKTYNEKLGSLNQYVGYKKIPIPPLVAILLSKCKTKEEIPEKLIELRNDFTELRKSFVDIEKRLDECDSVREQMKINDEFQSFWKAFSKKYKTTSNRLAFHFWDLKDKSNLNKAVENILDGNKIEDFTKDLNVTNFSTSILSKFYDLYKDRKALNRFKGVTNLWELFLDTPTLERQALDIERLFGFKVNRDELIKLANSIQK
ncbi:hypothetical protein [Hyunsoonleella rubra]